MSSKYEETKLQEFEYILESVGTTGPLNKAIFIITSFCGLIIAFNTFSYGFLGFTPPFWCQNDALASTDWTMEQRRNLTAPFTEGKFDGCKMHNVDYKRLSALPYSEAKSRMDVLVSQNVSQSECLVREFNTTFVSTVTQWDLVCDRRVLFSTTQAAIQLGMLFGSGIMGFLTDKFGRMRMFRICTVATSVCGFCTVFSPNVWIFSLLRFMSSVFGIGLYISGFVMAVEMTLPSHRSFTGTLFSVPWGLGIMVLPGIAYFVRPWHYLQVAIFIPTIFLLLGIWIVPESPRWLITNGRYEQAYKILGKMSKSNGKTLPEKKKLLNIMKDINTMANLKSGEEMNKSVMEKIRDTFTRLIYIMIDPKFRKQTLLVFYCWFAVSIIYYGVSLGSPTPNKDINAYLYLFIGGILEVVSYTVMWPVIDFLGRKKALFLCYAICAVSIVSAFFLITFSTNQEFIAFQWILFLIGKFFIAAAFKVVWLFTAELYPTNYRSIAVGESSTVARIGSLFSSYINDILVTKYSWAPAALFGALSTLAAVCVLLLPETTRENLQEISLEASHPSKRHGTQAVEA